MIDIALVLTQPSQTTIETETHSLPNSNDDNDMSLSSLPPSAGHPSALPPPPPNATDPVNANHGSSSSPSHPRIIRILTHNVWGLKHLSQHHTSRLAHIAHLLCNPSPTRSNPHPEPPDIVLLQELWTQADYRHLRRLTSSTLPHGKFYHSGCFGGGLVVLSRWRIVESRMVGYRLNGRPSAFWRGDWFVGKGVGWAKILLPERFVAAGGEGGRGGGRREKRRRRYLEVFNTHLHAPYDEGKDGKDTYSCHRVAQAWEMAGLMRRGMERGSLVVGGGDFNMVVAGLEYRVIQAQTRGLLRDVWREMYPESSVGAWIDGSERDRLKALGQADRGPPTVEESLRRHGHTCDSVVNTWRWSKAAQTDLLKKGRDRVVGPAEEDPRAKRLDYIFVGGGTGTGREPEPGTGPGLGECGLQEVRVCMTERHPELKCSLSDHFAVEAEIVLPRAGEAETVSDVHHEQPVRDEMQKQPRQEDIDNSDLYTAILHLISTYTARQRLHRRRRCIHFLASVVISLACFVAVCFSPANYVSFILLVLSSLGLMAGTVDGLIGLLFGGYELRALKEFEWEVRNAKRFEEEEERGRDAKGGVPTENRCEEEEEEEEMGRVKDWWD